MGQSSGVFILSSVSAPAISSATWTGNDVRVPAVATFAAISASPKRPTPWLKRAVWTTGIALFLYWFVIEPGMVPTSSMEGTVLVGDHLLMLKLPYGPQIPFTNLHLPHLRSPKAGEIVAFRSPMEPSEVFLKRVIAVAGDTVAIHRGRVYVNSVPVPDEYARVRPSRRSTWQENIPATRIPVGQIFVLGDNRDNSEDSRYFGTIPADNVVGEPLFVFWSYDAPSSEWLDPNLAHQALLYASAAGHMLTHTRWRRTGLLLCVR
jgi:signal peptidase I